MDERARRALHDVRTRMLNARGDNEPNGGHPLLVSILLSTATVGDEPTWSPTENHAELVPGELWARPAEAPEHYDVVAAAPARQHGDLLTLTTGTVTLPDLMGVNGVYDRPQLLDRFAVEDTATRTVLPEDHPVGLRHRFIEGIWDELVWQCQYNWLEPLKYSCPPMPSLTQLPDGIWRIGIALRICAEGVWDDRDDLHACFLAGLFDAYPQGKTEITSYVEDPRYPSTRAWQRLGVDPQLLSARELPNEPDDTDLPF
ncbi:hypothetical protein ACIA5G_51020 [Amycolatopsis sp. NPDC051758]|uniref:hypothetical protein n=1 Tax=Amycolatopsis sp. NPDC051758 TaxID=3363935 RepID=UPI0037AF35EF